MQDFIKYFKNLDYFAIIDAAIIVVIATALLIFLKRRNALKLAVLYAAYALIYLSVLIVTTITENHILYITHRILSFGWIFLAIVFAVVYQQDLKAMFGRLSRWNERKDNNIGYLNTDDDLRNAANEIVKACQAMSKNDIGALIVIAPSAVPQHVLETGTALNAEITSGLLQSIFNTKAPLHDGAVMIKDGRILAAGCFLPISQRSDISKELGTRHRAAIGITEESDVLAIVVSEETGVISVVNKGQIYRYMTPERLLEEIEKVYKINYIKRTKRTK